MLGSIPPRLAALLPSSFKLAELRIRSREQPKDSPAPGSTADSLKQLLGRLGKLRTSLERLQKTGSATDILPGGTSLSSAATAASSTSLNLTAGATYTTLRSTEQVNARPTSFSSRSPSLGPSSTTQPYIAGTYFGTQGDDTLTFTLLDSGTIGSGGPKRVEVTDGSSNVIDTLDFNGVAADTPLTLSNGLTLAFGAGDLSAGESFAVDVFASTRSAVDPDNAFDGSGDSSPIFEAGLSVVAGSFDVNGITINVAANDTINSVLAKIDASAAGVTAAFDTTREEVVLTQTTEGAANDIVLANDTSGFLAATKLDTASSVFPEFTTLESGEEVNTGLTSFTPVDPSFTGPSTSQPLIGGTYFGAQGSTTLTFKSLDNATVGDTGNIRIEIKDGNTLIETVNFGGLAPDTPITLSNGLTVSLGAGTVKKNARFTVDVSTSVGSAVDPTKTFNGTAANDPSFETGNAVTAGSFDVNGVTINVAADDTINSVLAKIDASGAGVTASFDATREKIVLTQTTAGSAEPITLENDTSGFLAATKLDVFAAIPGGDLTDEAADPINTVGKLSGITTGNLDINGVSIAVDITTDGIDDVIANINSSAAGVTASYDAVTSEVTITSNSSTADLVLDDGTTGFFTTVNIAQGTIQATEGSEIPGGETLSSPVAFENELESFGKELDTIFKETFEGVDEELLPAIEDVLSGAISDTFAKILGETGESKLRSSFGIDFDFRDVERGVSAFDTRTLSRSLETELEQITDFLFRARSSGETDGLVVSLIEAVKELEGTFEDALRSSAGETSGILVDLSV